MKDFCTLNCNFISSWGAISQVVALAAGGGVLGIIARNTIHEASQVGEALLWVAAFAWVTTLLDFMLNLFSRNTCHPRAQLAHALIISSAYICCTVLWGVYMTFPVSNSSKGLVVFALAVVTSICYFGLFIWAAVEVHKQRKGSSAKKEDKQAVMENGQTDEQEPLKDESVKEEETKLDEKPIA